MPKKSNMEDGSSVSKRRKQDVQKFVVTVRAEDLKGESPPSDSWSWRKYGQKPIKGSPHPRGYYKCSTAKGCPARKQVERCRTDASLLIITYTSDHNHAGTSTSPIQQQQPSNNVPSSDQALNCDMLLPEATVTAPKLCADQEESCDFFDELEELPVSASSLPSLACMVQEQLL